MIEDEKVEIVTLNRAVEIIRERNPGCYVTRGLLESAINNGEIGCIKVGSRRLVNVALIMKYLSEACEPAETGQQKGRRK